MKITRPRMVLGTVAISAAAILLPTAAAVAYISPPLVLLAEAQSPAQLVAKGAAVDVPVQYSCTADSMGLTVELTQKVGNTLTSGYGYLSVPCDGATHRTLLRVTSTSGGRAFAAGTAASQIEMWGCWSGSNRYVCGNDRIPQTIKLKR